MDGVISSGSCYGWIAKGAVSPTGDTMFNRLMAFLDVYFGEFWIWRKLRGGMWYRIEVAVIPQLGTFWVHRTIGRPEIVVEECCY